MAIQTTQMTIPQPEKNNKVNQSISAAAERWSVGNAKAANAANGGKDSSKVRSDDPVNTVAMSGTSTNQVGNATWRLICQLKTNYLNRVRIDKNAGENGGGRKRSEKQAEIGKSPFHRQRIAHHPLFNLFAFGAKHLASAGSFDIKSSQFT